MSLPLEPPQAPQAPRTARALLSTGPRGKLVVAEGSVARCYSLLDLTSFVTLHADAEVDCRPCTLGNSSNLFVDNLNVWRRFGHFAEFPVAGFVLAVPFYLHELHTARTRCIQVLFTLALLNRTNFMFVLGRKVFWVRP